MQIESIKDEGRGITMVISNDNKVFNPDGSQSYTKSPKDFYQIFIPGATIIPIQNPNQQQQNQQPLAQKEPPSYQIMF